MGHFGNESFQSITFAGTDNLTRTTKTQNIKHKQTQNPVSVLMAIFRGEPGLASFIAAKDNGSGG